MEKFKSSRIIDLAKKEINGFSSMFARLERKVILGGLSNSTLLNYSRCIASISLYFHQIPIQLEEEQTCPPYKTLAGGLMGTYNIF